MEEHLIWLKFLAGTVLVGMVFWGASELLHSDVLRWGALIASIIAFGTPVALAHDWREREREKLVIKWSDSEGRVEKIYRDGMLPWHLKNIGPHLVILFVVSFLIAKLMGGA